jgi:glycosyltransferase involved in cell wall biosynthesis
VTALVSICIPTHTERRLEYLREAIASARTQTHTNLEILLRDDGRDEAIRALATEQERLDPRVHYARNDRQLGLGGNWNALAQSTQGDFVVIVGDDDRLLPTFVERLLAAHDAETAVVFSNHYIIDPRGDRDVRMTSRFLTMFGREAMPGGRLADVEASVWRNSVPMTSALIRGTDLRRLGIKADLNTPEIELFARLAAEGKPFTFVPDYLAEFRVHPVSESSGGLAGERLVKYLDPIQVASHVEPLKREFMASLLAGGVNRALRMGDVEAAREMMRHRYYVPERRGLGRNIAQRALVRLPSPVARWSFGMIAAARRRMRSVAS